MTKREKLNAIQAGLRNSYYNVEHLGAKFFVTMGHGCVLRDVVNRLRREIEIDFEVYSYPSKGEPFYEELRDYYVGNKEAARNLQDEFGGVARMTEYEGLWTWEASSDTPHQDLNEVKDTII